MAQTDLVELKVFENGKRAPQYSLELDKSGEVTIQDFLKYTKQTIITVAKQALSEEQARGFDKDPIKKIDNKFNRREEDVSPLGQIEYIARQDVKEIFLFAFSTILRQSKVVTGKYLDSNVVFFNGQQIASSYPELEKWLSSQRSFKEADKIEFVNMAPYATKLELDGVHKGSVGKNNRKMVDTFKRGKPTGRKARKPNGTYTRALAIIKRRYKNNSFIKYQVMPGRNLQGMKIPTYKRKGRYFGQPYVYPSILIYVKAAGVLNE